MKNQNNILNEVIKQKNSFKDIIITTIIIAVGVNALTNGIIGIFKWGQNNILLIILGIILSLGVAVFYMFKKINSIKSNINLEGFMIYDTEKNEILEIPRYEISRDFCEYLKGAFVENNELKKLWNKEPISNIEKNSENDKKYDVASEKIFLDLLEYCVLDKLSVELVNYFDNINVKFEKLEELDRNNISDSLLENRFIKLFTEDINKRDAFLDYEDEDILNVKYEEKFCYIKKFYTGEIYNRMKLIFPKGTVIDKIENNCIKIDTKKYILKMYFYFDGISEVLDKEFEENYLKIENHLNENFDLRYNAYRFDVDIDIKFKLSTYFSRNKWEYYLWTESFIENLTEYLSKDRFFENINWKTVRTMLQCYNKNNVN